MSHSVPSIKIPAGSVAIAQVENKNNKFELSTSEKIKSGINTAAYFPITGQIIGVLRVIYGIAKTAINAIAAFFATYICCKPEKAARFIGKYEQGIQQIERGLFEIIPFGGLLFYKDSDQLAYARKENAFYANQLKQQALEESTADYISDPALLDVFQKTNDQIAEVNKQAKAEIRKIEDECQKAVAEIEKAFEAEKSSLHTLIGNGDNAQNRRTECESQLSLLARQKENLIKYVNKQANEKAEPLKDDKDALEKLEVETQKAIADIELNFERKVAEVKETNKLKTEEQIAQCQATELAGQEASEKLKALRKEKDQKITVLKEEATGKVADIKKQYAEFFKEQQNQVAPYVQADLARRQAAALRTGFVQPVAELNRLPQITSKTDIESQKKALNAQIEKLEKAAEALIKQEEGALKQALYDAKNDKQYTAASFERRRDFLRKESAERIAKINEEKDKQIAERQAKIAKLDEFNISHVRPSSVKQLNSVEAARLAVVAQLKNLVKDQEAKKENIVKQIFVLQTQSLLLEDDMEQIADLLHELAISLNNQIKVRNERIESLDKGLIALSEKDKKDEIELLDRLSLRDHEAFKAITKKIELLEKNIKEDVHTLSAEARKEIIGFLKAILRNYNSLKPAKKETKGAEFIATQRELASTRQADQILAKYARLKELESMGRLDIEVASLLSFLPSVSLSKEAMQDVAREAVSMLSKEDLRALNARSQEKIAEFVQMFSLFGQNYGIANFFTGTQIQDLQKAIYSALVKSKDTDDAPSKQILRFSAASARFKEIVLAKLERKTLEALTKEQAAQVYQTFVQIENNEDEIDLPAPMQVVVKVPAPKFPAIEKTAAKADKATTTADLS